MPLKSMKLTKDDTKAETSLVTEKPQYPYSLSLSLGESELKKLGITEMPKLGKKMLIVAVAEVNASSSDKTKDGERRRMGLQITEMSLEPEKEKKEVTEALYGDGGK